MSRPFHEKIFLAFDILMSALYAGIGIFILFSPFYPNLFPSEYNLVGILLLLYGVFRVYRFYQKIKED